MTPDQLCKGSSEHGHQRALFAWANMAMRVGFEAAWDDNCYVKQDGYACTMDYIRVAYPGTEAFRPAHMLDWLHAIPNGGAIGDKADDKRAAMIRGAQRKAEGVKAGVVDTMLPLPAHAQSLWREDWPLAGKAAPINGLFCGLWLEMKKPGKLKNTSKEQKQFIADMHARGYLCATADNWRDAAKIIQRYYEAKAV